MIVFRAPIASPCFYPLYYVVLCVDVGGMV